MRTEPLLPVEILPSWIIEETREAPHVGSDDGRPRTLPPPLPDDAGPNAWPEQPATPETGGVVVVDL